MATTTGSGAAPRADPATSGTATSKDSAQLVRRLSRMEGQVRGIARMIEREEYCVDILQQTAALRAAVDSLSILVLEDHVQGLRRTAAERGEADQYVDEVIDVVRRTLGRPVRGRRARLTSAARFSTIPVRHRRDSWIRPVDVPRPAPSVRTPHWGSAQGNEVHEGPRETRPRTDRMAEDRSEPMVRTIDAGSGVAQDGPRTAGGVPWTAVREVRSRRAFRTPPTPRRVSTPPWTPASTLWAWTSTRTPGRRSTATSGSSWPGRRPST